MNEPKMTSPNSRVHSERGPSFRAFPYLDTAAHRSQHQQSGSFVTFYKLCASLLAEEVLGSQRSRSNMGLLVADLGTAAELPGKQMCGVAGKTDVPGLINEVLPLE
ncbi:hypothetical protein Bbelb_194890 [Branchiostoma belcheri]|nr:hypothetical protein Bbelb_194890 [Branchiostoma belcheri]